MGTQLLPQDLFATNTWQAKAMAADGRVSHAEAKDCVYGATGDKRLLLPIQHGVSKPELARE